VTHQDASEIVLDEYAPYTREEWEALRERLDLANVPPHGRVLNAEELRWLARYCPYCHKSRADCECIWP
jgi:hypothetical protein